MRINLTKNFYLDEFTFSETAIRHGVEIVVEEGSLQFKRLQRYCETFAQPLRDVCGPLNIVSGYRPLEVNRLVGSGDGSQHIECLAGDVVPVEVTPLELCEAAIDLGLPYDQLIHEFGRWCHGSIAEEDEQPRGEVLTAYKFRPRVGKVFTKYEHGLHTIESLTSGS
ncbi:MAG: peptidase M15A [Thiotrichaceae bacterium]|nr:MAG: peptidase M15A [Thiotrichaceae bacterium]